MNIIESTVFAFFVSLFMLSPVSALDTPQSGTTELGPKDAVVTTIDKAKAMVDEGGDTTSLQFKKDFEKVIFSVFDFEEMARRSLGKNWKTATKDERQQFVDLFSSLLSKTYLNRVINGFPNSIIKYGNEKVENKRAALKTTILSDGETVSVMYRLKKKKTGWRVYDIVIENVSLVSNYRSEFAGIVRKEKMNGLISKLREKLAKPDNV